MKRYIFIILLFSWELSFSQLAEDFTDGDFTVNPVWSGSNSSGDFAVISNQLRSNSTTASSNFYLSTISSLAVGCTWELWCNLQFSTSGSNYTDIYLTSDQADLQSANINGYFVRIGNTDDEISLYKRAGARTTSVKIIDGVNSSIGTSNNIARIKVTRTSDNLFTLERDLSGTGSSYFTEGSVTDAQITTSTHFGIFIQQSTSTFFQKHFFDGIKITPIVTDTAPPEVVSARSLDSLTVEVIFNESLDSITAKNPANYLLSGSNNPVSVTLINASSYKLHYNQSLQTATYTLTVSNVNDLNGNRISSSNSAQFNFVKPYEVRRNDVAINEIFADPSPQIDLPGLEFIELRNTTDKVISLKNWKYSDPSTTFTFGSDSIKANEFLILCAKTDTLEYKRFGRVIGISPWPSLNNSGDIIKLISDKNVTINEISYSDSWYKDTAKKQGGYTLERIDPLSKCEGLFNWRASIDISGGTPGRANSVYQQNYDLIPLKADSIRQISDTTIKIYFNKSLDQTTVTSDKVIITPAFASLKSILLDTDAKQATVTYTQKFTAATKFAMYIQSVKDCSGNVITGLNQPFEFATDKLPAVRPDTAHVFITEFFPDPSPEVGLPLAEFVEIYNSGTDTIDLDGWSLNDPTAKAVLGKISILPKQYLILCQAADTTQYKAFGKVAGLSPWPSFNNSSDQIILRSFTNRTADSVSYNDTWYKDVVKKQGGWSLERIDPLSKCNSIAAWGVSKDNTGGTPGKVNSIYQKDYDLLELHADSLKRMSDSTVTVYFNKNLNQASVTANKFVLSPSSGLIKNTVLNLGLNQISLTFNQIFSPETAYSLSVQSVEDCAGNLVSNVNQPLKFSTPALPPTAPVRSDTAKIFITEIFADPSPEVGLPLAEFVEIYNPGIDTVDLDGWLLSDATAKASIRKSFILPKEYLILCPAADTSQYKMFGKAVGLSPWPSFSNVSDQVILKSFANRVVDSVSYKDTWYKDALKKSGGWSLERIDPLSKCSSIAVWGPSNDGAGGTPGKVNSIYNKNYDLLEFHTDSVKRMSDSTVIVYFNKPVNQGSFAKESFSLDPQPVTIKKAVLNTDLNQASLTFNQRLLPSTTYSLSIQAVKDCGGKNISTTNQPLKFLTPHLPVTPPTRLDTANIRITEIFADPSPEIGLPLAEFVEIYNPGKDTINLDGWTFSDLSSKAIIKKAVIHPDQYLILCPAADTIHYKNLGDVIGLSPWPALGNSADQIALRSFKNRTIDSIAYNDTWYKDLKKKQGGWSLELTSQSKCSGWYNWTASSNISGGTPGRINSIHDQPVALKMDSVHVTSDSTLRVYFNTIQDTLFLKPANFKLNARSPLLIKPAADFRSVNLTFSDPFTEGISYTLVAEELRTCSGSIISQANKQSSFTIPVSPELSYPVVINEIFADTSPVVGLPDAEFVELFNPTDKVVLLNGLVYEDAGTLYHFTSGSIEPGGYLILCPLKDTLSYKPFGNVQGLNPWPGLNNDKEVLVLRNNKGKEFHRATYEFGWHKENDKKSGGWSLELIDPNAVCSGRQNWASSTDPSGGTPGRFNSVYKTNTSIEPLKLLSGILTDSTTVLLTFNRTIDSLSGSGISNYTINNGIGNPFNATVMAPDFTQVALRFSAPITRGNRYKITVNDITDCSGSIIASNKNSAEFFFPQRISKGDILINEILFNPRKDGADFVEIYNNSQNELDLKDLKIATIKDSLTSIKAVSAASQLISPGKYLVLTTDPDNIKKEYFAEKPDAFLRLSSLPSFSDDAGVVVLLSDNLRIDELRYSDKMHNKIIKDPEGVSLERSSFTKPTNETGNFRSAAGTSGYATPGYKNSQFLEDVTAKDEIFLTAKTFSPDNDGFEDVLQLNYKFEEPGRIANVTIYNDYGVLVKKLTKNLSLAASGTIYWDGLTEINEKAGVGIYVLFIEVFDLQGRVKKYKRSFALAAKLI